MNYPAIVYELEGMKTQHADGYPYTVRRRYQVMHISRDPDDDCVNRLSHIPTATFSRRFTQDNLYHTVYSIYF